MFCVAFLLSPGKFIGAKILLVPSNQGWDPELGFSTTTHILFVWPLTHTTPSALIGEFFPSSQLNHSSKFKDLTVELSETL